MEITVLTPDKAIFSGDIYSVKVPGTAGEFQVLNNHAAIVSSLEKGTVTIKKTEKGGDDLVFTIEKGFIEVLNNNIALLVQGVRQ